MDEGPRIYTLFPVVGADMPVASVLKLVARFGAQGIVLADSLGFFRLSDLQGAAVKHGLAAIGQAMQPRAWLREADAPEVDIAAEEVDPVIVGRVVFEGAEMVRTLDPFILNLPPSTWVCAFGHDVAPLPEDGMCPDHGLPLQRR